MKTVTLHFPESLNIEEWEISMFLASKLYEDGKLSLGQAADLVGLTKKSFAELLGKYGVSLFNFPSSDLARDVNNA